MNDKLRDHLQQCQDERLGKYTMELVDKWPKLTDFDTRVYLGMFAWTMPNIGQRLVWNPTHVNIGFGIETPGDVVRDYLGFKYPKRLRCTTEQYHKIMAHRSFPCYARRGEYHNMVYVDLKSAYWSIITAVGWDVDYNPGVWLGVRSSILDFPLPDNKPARSALVTAGLSSPVRVWAGGKLTWQTTNNNHVNYGLWALVQDVLHGVAAEMLSIGAVYVHTDGYIVPGDRVGDALEIADSWGLRLGQKASGDAHIYGVGVYKVGDVKTKRDHALPFKDHINIDAVYPDWLKKRFRPLSEKKHQYQQVWLTGALS